MIIGILGGIGPSASAEFYHKLVLKLQDSGKFNSNTEFPRIIINSIPAPELTSFTINKKLLQPYIDGIKQLKLHQPDFIVMSCNTIHLYLDTLKEACNFEQILSIRDIVKNHLPQHIKGKISVIGTPLTVTSQLYNYSAYDYIEMDKADLIELGEIVNDFNVNNNFHECQTKLVNITNKLQDKGAKIFILACTEISLLLNSLKSISTINTLDVLIEHVTKKVIDSTKRK